MRSARAYSDFHITPSPSTFGLVYRPSFSPDGQGQQYIPFFGVVADETAFLRIDHKSLKKALKEARKSTRSIQSGMFPPTHRWLTSRQFPNQWRTSTASSTSALSKALADL